MPVAEDSYSTGVHISTRADVTSGLAVCLAEWENQNLYIIIGKFLVRLQIAVKSSLAYVKEYPLKII